ncbi:NAD(P)-dependent dehydrogenase, short-chain alcohol dehydrogenase family [Pedobacter westerhofensis]|uniref:NAD(P)-dependent dehydrogenase, short-chain alcohol dehydrogenase family n=1 Tax=Pedobacter westerhofensis TaxID=425512 RepID=A0A521AE93_9SPHI|nr:SDR family NAD(P)-dependent oxidoreductase [Pedobacter westerhofensis]SMO33096.1 NAD(P)-dependent dehydrogenase, short-chain alcohol dehydrogenase family [Pedobacter westerhofensis]
MDLKFKTKRVLVTGSSAGLGEAIARLMAAEGAEVVVHGRNEERAATVARSINDTGGRAIYVLGDLSTDEGADAVANGALAGGPVDILVNNAGAYTPRPWLQVGVDDWRDSYNVNVLAYVRMIHRLLPAMKTLGWGRMVQIGSSGGIEPFALQPDYLAATAARHNLTVSLARELKGTGITSNTVAPGPMLVENTRDMLLNMAGQYGWGDNWADIERNAVEQFVQNDVGRFGKPEEIAAAVAYLSSPMADYVTGALLRVDGGHTRSV